MTIPLPEASSNQSPDEHMQISRRFIEHAREELAKGERLQASQKIWGAEQHALTAVGKEEGLAHRGLPPQERHCQPPGRGI